MNKNDIDICKNFESEIEEILFKELKKKFHIDDDVKLYYYLKLRTWCINNNYDFKNKDLIIKTIFDELFIVELCYKNVLLTKYYNQINSLSNIIDNQEFRLSYSKYKFNTNYIINEINNFVNAELKKYKYDIYFAKYKTYFALQKLNEIFHISKIEEVLDIPGFKQSESRINRELECSRYLHLANFETDNLNSITEKKLEDYLITHLEVIEKGLKFVTRQLSLDEGRIDILALDNKENYVIIELKISIDKTIVWQCMYYPDALKERFKTNRVRMITVMPEYPEYLLKPLKKIKNIECLRYKAIMSNHKIEKLKIQKVKNRV